jgi:hypothetical protein
MWYLIFIETSAKYGIQEHTHQYSSVCVEMSVLHPPWYILKCIPAVTEHLAAHYPPEIRYSNSSSGGIRPMVTHNITGILQLANREQASEWEKPEDPVVVHRAIERARLVANYAVWIEACKTPAERERMEKTCAKRLANFDSNPNPSFGF